MAFHDEVTMRDGIAWEGDTTDAVRTNFSVEGYGKPEYALGLNLNIVTGSTNITVCSITPKDMKRLGEFLVQVAEEKAQEAKDEYDVTL